MGSSFDILCGRATHIVAVIEDFDGGYVRELGLLFHRRTGRGSGC